MRTKKRIYHPLCYVACLVAVTFFFMGCAMNSFSMPTPFWGQNSAESSYDNGVHERLDSLKEVQKTVEKMSPEEQERIAQSLARSYANKQPQAVQIGITKTFGYINTPTAIKGLEMALQDANPEIRIEAVRSLGRLRSPAALQALVATQNSDTNLDVRLAVTEELGGFKSNQAVLALSQSLKDSDPAMQFLAMQSLSQVTGEDLGNDVRQWQQYVSRLPTSPSNGTPESNSPENVANELRDLR